MMGKDHALGGAAAWLVPCALLAPSAPVVVLGTGLAVAGSLAPDVDHRRADAARFARLAGSAVCVAAVVVVVLVAGPKDRAARAAAAGGVLLALLPWAVRPRCGRGYRGWPHSLIGLAVASGLAFVPCLVTGWPVWAGAAVMAGWCSHLVLDAMTREGLPLAWTPLGRGPRFGWLPAGWSIITGGKRRRSRRRRTLAEWYAAEGERVLVRPALALIVAASAAWIVMGGGHG